MLFPEPSFNNNLSFKKPKMTTKPSKPALNVVEDLIKVAKKIESVPKQIISVPRHVLEDANELLYGGHKKSQKENNKKTHSTNGNKKSAAKKAEEKIQKQKKKEAKAKARALKKSNYNANTMTSALSNPVINMTTKLKNSRVETFNIRVSDINIATDLTPGRVLVSKLVDRTLFNGTYLDPVFDQFERYSVSNMQMKIVPSVATGTPGTIYIQTDPDAGDALSLNQTMPVGYITGHKNSKQHTLFGEVYSTSCTLNKAKLFCDPSYIQIPGSEDDPRLNSAGVVNVYLGEGVTNTNFSIGTIWISGKIAFSEPGFNDNSRVVCCFKSVCTGSGTLSTAGLNYSAFATMNNLVTNNYAGTAYVEAYFAPTLFNGTSISLPVGSYYVECGMAFSGNPGATSGTFSLVNVSKYTSSLNASTMSALGSAPYFEWINPPTAGTVNSNNPQLVNGIIRVTQVSAGSNFWNLNVTGTTTNSVSLALLSLIILRIPENISALYAAPFPRGSSSQVAPLVKENKSELLAKVQKLMVMLESKEDLSILKEYEQVLLNDHFPSLSLAPKK